MDFKQPDLSKIVNFDQIEKASKAGNNAGVDKLAMVKMMVAPMLKSLPAKAKYMIGFAILSLGTGIVTIVYLIVKFIAYLVGLAL